MTYVFIRLIKSGSTTIVNHLLRHKAGHVGMGKRTKRNLVIPEHIEFFIGHDVYYGIHEQHQFHGEVRYFTILRDPADWLVSQYHHDEARRQTGRDFWEWYDDPAPTSVNPIVGTRNLMMRWYQRHNPDPIDWLNRIWFVGTAETSAEWMPRLFRTWGVPEEAKNERVTGTLTYGWTDDEVLYVPEVFKLDEAGREKIYRENPEDVALYKYATRLYETRYAA